jgi:capsular exopolysaccharide synthesis family protein
MSNTNTPPPPEREGDAAANSRRQVAYHGPVPYYNEFNPAQEADRRAYGTPVSVAPYYGTNYANRYGYGGPEYGGGGGEEETLLGAITLARMIRVCTQRWMTIAVVAVLGAVGAFVVYHALPSIFEGVSLFEMSLRPKKIISRVENSSVDESLFGQSEEIYNTRILKLHSREVLLAVLQRYKSDNPSMLFTDEQLIETLSKHTEVTLQRRTRLIRVTVRSTSQELSVALANAYVDAVDTYTQEQNREQAEKAKDFLKTTVETQKRELVRQDELILNFRRANQIDTMEGERKKVEAAQLTLNADAVLLETHIARASEVMKVLEGAQGDVGKFGALPESTPQVEGLATVHQKLQDAVTERNMLLTRFTASHPDVAAKERQVVQLRAQFADEVARVRDTAKANLELLQKQLLDNRKRCEDTDRRASELEQKIVTAKMKLEALLRERKVAEENFSDTLNRERVAQMAYDDNAATISVVEKAMLPQDEQAKPHPVSPNPYIVLPAGPAIGILLGILFVLLLDHLEDKITGIGDIEHRLRLKTLSVLPHIRRAKREQVAMLSAEDRFSHFAESFAGLRNLLDSPRYAAVSKALLVISTQPGEGKTITASNLALSCALAGQRTLLVDFDLRRPRLARIYKKERDSFESLFHILSANDPTQFSRLPTPSGYENLDLICTRPSLELSPSNLLGSGMVTRFLDWARQNYDRVLIDSPPFGVVYDSVVLSSLADGVLVMCCPDRTRFRAIKHAVRHLSEAGGHILGVVVNDVDFGRAGMFGRYDYDNRYSYRHKYGAKYGYGARPGEEREADDEADGNAKELAKGVAAPPRSAVGNSKESAQGVTAPPRPTVLADDDDE